MTIRSKVTIWSSFLLIILLVGMLCACGGTTPEAPPSSDTPSTPVEPDTPVTPDDSDTSQTPDDSDMSPTPADKVEVVYFYRPQRCYSCVYAETATIYTLETYFADELASGKITFVALDVTAEENADTVEKYDAYSSSLFINTIVDGTDHIETVSEIWLVIGDDEAFTELVKSKIEQSLTGEE
jgi:predicted small lipoprotein YifL